jgi:hypothetical protein
MAIVQILKEKLHLRTGIRSMRKERFILTKKVSYPPNENLKHFGAFTKSKEGRRISISKHQET